MKSKENPVSDTFLLRMGYFLLAKVVYFLTGENGILLSWRFHPEKLRRIKYIDSETGKRFVFLTNNFVLAPRTVADLYKCRWQVELFFKWIKQHLRIKSFFGTSENAVKTQIWIAISAYLLVAIMKKRLKLELSLYTILQVTSISLFEKNPIFQVLTEHNRVVQEVSGPVQLELFG